MRTRRPVLALVAIAGLAFLNPAPAAAAGAVRVEARNGFLVITGDEQDNAIKITKPGPYQIEPTDGTTSVNGSLAPKLISTPKGIKADMGGGRDAISIEDAAVTGGVEVKMTEGELRAQSSTIQGPLSFTTASGDDALELLGSTVDGKVSFKAGHGETTTRTSSTLIHGELTVTGGDGADDVSVGQTNFVGRVSIKAGEGDTVTALTNANLPKGLRIQSRTGEDRLEISNSDLRGIDVDFGDGDTTVIIDDGSAVDGNLRLRSQSGEDELTLETGTHVMGNVQLSTRDGRAWPIFRGQVDGGIQLKRGSGSSGAAFGPGGSVHGKTRIKNGDGGGVSQCDSHTFLRDVKISTRSGYAQTRLENCTFERKLSVDVGRGGGTLAINEFGGGPSRIGGNLSFAQKDESGALYLRNLTVDGKTKARIGGDWGIFVTIFDSIFLGPVSVKTSEGADVIALEADVGDPGDSLFAGKVKIATGAGDDTIRVGRPAASDDAEFLAKVTYDGGTGTDTLDHLGHGNTYVVPPTVKNIESEP